VKRYAIHLVNVLIQVKLAQAVAIISKKVLMNLLSHPAKIPNIFLAVWTGLHTKCQQHESPQLTKKRPGTWPGLWCEFSSLVNSPNYSVTARPYCCAWSAGSSAGWAHPHCQERRAVSVAEA
jgi:hypothetical protein